jgi:hypothetical protein
MPRTLIRWPKTTAKNGFDMLLTTQSFATGGWGPDEMLRAPGRGALGDSLSNNYKL